MHWWLISLQVIGSYSLHNKLLAQELMQYCKKCTLDMFNILRSNARFLWNACETEDKNMHNKVIHKNYIVTDNLWSNFAHDFIHPRKGGAWQPYNREFSHPSRSLNGWRSSDVIDARANRSHPSYVNHISDAVITGRLTSRVARLGDKSRIGLPESRPRDWFLLWAICEFLGY